MAAEESVYTALQSLVSGRCYPVKMAQKATLPAIVYERVSSERETTLNRSEYVANTIIVVNCYAATIAAARTLADSVKSAMNSAGVVNELQDDSMEYDPETDLDFISMRYSCWETS